MDNKEEHPWDDFNLPRLTILPWIIWAAIWVAVTMFLFATGAYAGPIAEGAGDNGAKVTLYSEPCALKNVTNLANKATWQEKGKIFQGCFGLHPYGVVLAYFDDGTVVIMPVDIFKQVKDA